MKVLLQRVSRAEVRVGGEVVSSIGRGLLVFLGVERGDSEANADWYAARTAVLRLFPSDERPLERSVEEIGGEILVVSQFTLAARTRKGRRPSFDPAAEPALAEALYERFASSLRRRGLSVATGSFGATMQVELVNEGPVTFLLEGPEVPRRRKVV
jgi:D-tyrosyl-tRNA(Tyr) deacylase